MSNTSFSAAMSGAGFSTQAVTSFFQPLQLSVVGDGLANAITVDRDAAGRLLVNGGAVSTFGGTPTVANVQQIQILGMDGSDRLALDERSGPMPALMAQGGAGDDTVIGGSFADTLFGQEGNDSLLGGGGNDLLSGGADNDTLVGGTGNDSVYGEGGNDLMVWNAGDGFDLMEGGSGFDTVRITGGTIGETFNLAPGSSGRIQVSGSVSLNLGTVEEIVLDAGGGDDIVNVSGNVATLALVRIDGGSGNDTITGSTAAESLVGGSGNDVVRGAGGADFVLLGSGDDRFVWNAFDGNDTIEGQIGADLLQANGNGSDELIVLKAQTASGGDLLLQRGSETLRADDLETVNLAPAGGADLVQVRSLAGTDVQQVLISLAAAGSTAADGRADTVFVEGTAADNVVEVRQNGTQLEVLGLSARVVLQHTEVADRLIVAGADGDDTLSAPTVGLAAIRLSFDGGNGNDTLFGSAMADIVIGGAGNDSIDGGGQNDILDGGAGFDRFVWNPGDGSDSIDGGADHDQFFFNGGAANERFTLAADGGRVLASRDIANVVHRIDGVEALVLATFGGTDQVRVESLAGTAVSNVFVNLAASAFSDAGDGLVDLVEAVGGSGADTLTLAVNASGLTTVAGLPTGLGVSGADAGRDIVRIAALGGDDRVDASAMPHSGMRVELLGGEGADTLVGGAGDDLAEGGAGSDLLQMGGGDDRITLRPGDGHDTVDGGTGFDTLRIVGQQGFSDILALGSQDLALTVQHATANLQATATNVQVIEIAPGTGADLIHARSFGASPVIEMHVDLARGGNGAQATQADGEADTVIVEGSEGDDVMLLAMEGSTLVVRGASATVRIDGFDPALDTLVLNALGGDDVIEASALPAGLLKLQYLGGEGNDVLVGSAGNETFDGGAGDDVIVRGGGTDIVLVGVGDLVL